MLASLVASLAVCQSEYKWTEMWYDGMDVDHFSFDTNDTFSLRYLINKDSWDSNNGPIFFYCGNEGDIELFARNTGFMWDIAPEFKAMVVFAEHRFYGKTMPYGNDSYKSPERLGKLSTEQALADYAVLLTFLKRNVSGAANSPVIAFGGSYGGMLAAWFRVKYPHVVTGALASSAPILQFDGYTPCWVFPAIVTRTFANSGAGCDQVIKKSWPAIRRMAKTPEGRGQLNQIFKLCVNSTIDKEADADSLVNWLNAAYGNLAMIDYPYETNFLNPVPGWPVRAVCQYLTNPNASDADLLTNIFQGVSVFYNFTGQASCYQVADESSQATQDLGISGWDFQACTEMVMPMCQNGTDMFEPSPWDFNSYSDGCFARLGVRPRLEWATTNFGGDKLAFASNIIFTNGYLDPWSGGGVLTSLSDSLLAIQIKDGAHHYELRGKHPKDTEAVRNARELIRAVLKKWLRLQRNKTKEW